jgi:hypothetical protein
MTSFLISTGVNIDSWFVVHEVRVHSESSLHGPVRIYHLLDSSHCFGCHCSTGFALVLFVYLGSCGTSVSTSWHRPSSRGIRKTSVWDNSCISQIRPCIVEEASWASIVIFITS